MAPLIYLLLAIACPLTTCQMFNSMAQMLNPQLINAVFNNLGAATGGQTVNIGTDGNTGLSQDDTTLNIGVPQTLGVGGLGGLNNLGAAPTTGGQTVNIGTDGIDDLSSDDSTLNFGVPQTQGVGGFGGFPAFGAQRTPGTNQNLGQISQIGIGNTLNLALPSQPGGNNNLLLGQLTQKGVGNTINLGQNQAQQTFGRPPNQNLNIGQLNQQGIGNAANFGRQQPQNNGLLPGQTSAINPQSFGTLGAQNPFFGAPAVQNPLFGAPAAQNALFGQPAAQNPLFGQPNFFGQVPPPPIPGRFNRFPPRPRPFRPLIPNFVPVPFFGG